MNLHEIKKQATTGGPTFRRRDMTLMNLAREAGPLNKITSQEHGTCDCQRIEREVFLDAAERGARYVDSVRSRRVTPSPADLESLTKLPMALPSDPIEAKDIIELLDHFGSPATVASGGGRYFGFVCGGALPAARAAAVLAAAWDQNAGVQVLSPIAAHLEEVSLRWVVDVLGLPEETGGAIVTGGTMASFTCLAAARHHLLAKSGWDVEEAGLFGAPAFSVYVSENTHASVLKSLSLLGLGRRRVAILKTDQQGRILVNQLPKLEPHSIVCIQAGDVNTGACDCAPALCIWAHAGDAWVHVDGAFGLWAAASPRFRGLTSGMELADSWATDGHKWLNAPYDCGFALVKHANSLRSAMSLHAAYLKQSDALRDPSHWNPELSRRARGVEVWAALLSLGRSGIADLVERTCDFARAFAVGLANAGFEILNEPVLNQVLVSFGTDEQTESIVAAVQKDGTCWCGTTIWKGRRAMRISVSSWTTTREDVARSIAVMVRLAHCHLKEGE
jgi:glutamate/tyrosine decarboxylase-like PLP-dependent enzyme